METPEYTSNTPPNLGLVVVAVMLDDEMEILQVNN